MLKLYDFLIIKSYVIQYIITLFVTKLLKYFLNEEITKFIIDSTVFIFIFLHRLNQCYYFYFLFLLTEISKSRKFYTFYIIIAK